MKNINFIHALSPKKQYEIQRWIYLSSIMLCLTIIIISSFLAPELYNLYALKKEIGIFHIKSIEYDTLTKKKEILKQKSELLQTKTSKINRYAQHTKNPHSYINTIIAAASGTIKIELISLHKKALNLIVLCSFPKQATHLIKELTNSQQFSHLTLTSLTQDPQTKLCRAVIKGKKAHDENKTKKNSCL